MSREDLFEIKKSSYGFVFADCYATAAGHPGSYTRNREACLLCACVQCTETGNSQLYTQGTLNWETLNRPCLEKGKQKKHAGGAKFHTHTNTETQSECSVADQVE